MEPDWQLFGLSEAAFRFVMFALVALGMVALELGAPRRALAVHWVRRWTTNLSLFGLSVVVLRALRTIATFVAVPLVTTAAAFWAQAHDIGLFNLFTLPLWLDILLTLVVLDFAIWLQHWLSHKVPLFWRVHRVHHADRDFDVTTALRFHPVEIGASMLYKCVWVIALGISPLAVVLFEVMLNACAIFNHANWAMPRSLERIVRLVLVTPDMHRIHHSTDAREHNTNFGFNLSIWDRLFRTYTHDPRAGHDHMSIGLTPYQHEGPTRLGWSFHLPFTRGGNTEAGRRDDSPPNS
jgi:sterol desaturase/sphingolipid hydroxylase (fatty acid hydroxylase superfamily)